MAAPLKPVPAQLTFDNSSIGFVYAGILGVIALDPSVISQGGANIGDVLMWSGSAWAPAAPSGGSTSYTLDGGDASSTYFGLTADGGDASSSFPFYAVLDGGGASG